VSTVPSPGARVPASTRTTRTGTRVRPATRADLGRVAEIAAHFVRETCVTFEEDVWDLPAWERKLDDVTELGLPFLVAEAVEEADDETAARADGAARHAVAGYAYASPWRPKPAYRHTAEDTIYLDPAFAGRGIGTTLLDALLDACTTAGVRQLVSVVADVPESAGSVPLHRRFGFVETGRLTAVGFKHGRWVDTILLQRSL
jgi:L-amino acid N-acyltransferase YncA